MRLFFVLAVFILTVTAAKAEQSDRFDSVLTWLVDNHMVGDAILSDSDSPLHNFTIPLVAAPPEFAKSGVHRVGTKAMGAYPVYTDDRQRLIMLINGQLQHFDHNSPILGGQYLFRGVDQSAISVRMVFLYHQTDAAAALIRMYESTGEKRYLNLADRLLRNAYGMVDDDGVFRLHFSTLGPAQMGMPQAILIKSLVALEKHGSEWATEAIISLSDTFKHSTEGTWDHWSSSVIGAIIANKRKSLSDEELALIWHPYLQEILAQIRANNGKVPHMMKTGEPQWPAHKPSYQSYNLLLLLELAEMDQTTAKEICELFPAMFDAAPELSRMPGARKVLAADYGHRICGIDNDAYIKERADAVATVPTTSVDVALGQMTIASVRASLDR